MRPFWKRDRIWRRLTTLSRFYDDVGQAMGTRLLVKNHPIVRSHADLVYFSLYYTGSPLPTPAELDMIDEVQDRLDELGVKLEFYNPAIIMLGGKRDWILYTRDGGKLMNELHLELSHFGPIMECQHDPRWSQYRAIRRL